MANTYTQIHIQVVFAVKNRESLIKNEWKTELYKYISGIIKNNGHKLLQINGVQDHIHVLIGHRPNQALSDLIKQVKQASSIWINKSGLTNSSFSWQPGFGAFSYSKSDLPQVIKYIKDQEEHHKRKSFIEEYTDLLKAFSIDYDSQYIFKEVE